MIYEGDYLDGQRHGIGTITLADGFKYTGDWEYGEITGVGIATYANGDIYQGSFVKGKRQGRGTIKFASGESSSVKWDAGALVETGSDYHILNFPKALFFYANQKIDQKILVLNFRLAAEYSWKRLQAKQQDDGQDIF